jgi:hypothetical protein
VLKPPSTQVFLDGIIQRMTLDQTCIDGCAAGTDADYVTCNTQANLCRTACGADAACAAQCLDADGCKERCKKLCGGSMRVMDTDITVPRNAMVYFPANQMTFQVRLCGHALVVVKVTPSASPSITTIVQSTQHPPQAGHHYPES